MDVSTHETAGARTIKPRAPGVKFDAAMPRYWFGGMKQASLLANGVNLLFPKGERFFVRSVMHYLPQLDDAGLRAQVKGFAGQEHRHARAHEDYNLLLEAQGYEVERFLKVYERVAFEGIERIASPALRLAVTAATEHFTAIMAEDALSRGYFTAMNSEVGRMLMWHAAEEIEHKAVAFDVLRAVAPSYRLRVAGLALATAGLLGFWSAATVWLLVQDWKAGRVPATRDVALMREQVARVGDGVLLQGIRAYLRRDFHPSQIDDAHLAAAYLARAGLEPVEEKA